MQQTSIRKLVIVAWPWALLTCEVIFLIAFVGGMAYKLYVYGVRRQLQQSGVAATAELREKIEEETGIDSPSTVYKLRLVVTSPQELAGNELWSRVSYDDYSTLTPGTSLRLWIDNDRHILADYDEAPSVGELTSHAAGAVLFLPLTVLGFRRRRARIEAEAVRQQQLRRAALPKARHKPQHLPTAPERPITLAHQIEVRKRRGNIIYVLPHTRLWIFGSMALLVAALPCALAAWAPWYLPAVGVQDAAATAFWWVWTTVATVFSILFGTMGVVALTLGGRSWISVTRSSLEYFPLEVPFFSQSVSLELVRELTVRRPRGLLRWTKGWVLVAVCHDLKEEPMIADYPEEILLALKALVQQHLPQSATPHSAVGNQ